MTVSITDVARVAGVSASTVSRALRGRPGVSEEVRAQIADVATRLGYTASRSASSLASGRTFTIGVVVPYIGRWFFGTVLDAAERIFSAAGYDVLLYNLGSPEARKRFFTRLPVRKRVDAVLSLLIPDEEEAAVLRSLGVPLAITVGGAREGFTAVGIDDRAGAEMRRTASGEPRPPPNRHDLRGQRAAALDHSDRPAPGVPGRPGRRRDRARSGPGGGRRLHRRGRRAGHDRLLAVARPPTAVFAQSDEMAMGALRALRRHRLKVPDDVSVVGFDDHELADVVGPDHRRPADRRPGRRGRPAAAAAAGRAGHRTTRRAGTDAHSSRPARDHRPAPRADRGKPHPSSPTPPPAPRPKHRTSTQTRTLATARRHTP